MLSWHTQSTSKRTRMHHATHRSSLPNSKMALAPAENHMDDTYCVVLKNPDLDAEGHVGVDGMIGKVILDHTIIIVPFSTMKKAKKWIKKLGSPEDAFVIHMDWQVYLDLN